MNSSSKIGASIFSAGKKNQPVLLGISLIATGFLVIAANAIWNQEGAHPSMILHPGDSQKENSIKLSRDTIPVRKVATKPIGTAHLTPVPSQRPDSAILELSDNRQKVWRLQELLFSQGYIMDKPDGIWGPVTAKATAAFLKDKGMPTIISELQKSPEKAMVKLSEIETRKKAPTSDGIGDLLEKNTPSPTLIAKVQVGLINYGHRDIAIDGIVGNQTRAAISEFEKRFDMPVTGEPSEKLIEKLYSVGALTQ